MMKHDKAVEIIMTHTNLNAIEALSLAQEIITQERKTILKRLKDIWNRDVGITVVEINEEQYLLRKDIVGSISDDIQKITKYLGGK